MKLTLPSEQRVKLKDALRKAGTNEIGGQLFGEQHAPSDFMISEISIQPRQGTFARFVVDVVAAANAAIRFFDSTQHQYTRFNYIGEWHSHPSFVVQPSGQDLFSMRALVSQKGFAGSFAVLMIVREDTAELIARAWYFDPIGREGTAELKTTR